MEERARSEEEFRLPSGRQEVVVRVTALEAVGAVRSAEEAGATEHQADRSHTHISSHPVSPTEGGEMIQKQEIMTQYNWCVAGIPHGGPGKEMN